jgi:hypothetical protein
MDLNGEEKRIQALFHELKAQDDKLALPFARTWNTVEARSGFTRRRPISALTFPRLIAAALVIGSLVTVIVIQPWRLPRQPIREPLATTKETTPASEAGVKPTSEANSSGQLKPKQNKSIAVVHRPTGRRLVAKTSLRKDRKIELSRWQSPTAGLLRSPGYELLKNSPALNQSAHEMRGFLSNLN